MSVAASPTTPLPTTCAVCGSALLAGAEGVQCPRCVLALAEDSTDEEEALVAELFPELKVLGRLALGGCGTVWRAEHRRLRRAVALKFLDSRLARTPAAIARFSREIEAAARLEHAGIVRTHDAGERGGQWFMQMELIEGTDAGALARARGPLPVAEACEVVRQAALALHHAHGQGVIHRDVKPGNIMIAEDGTVKVLDFGLAQVPQEGEPITLSGELLGTPEYMAPEQIEAPSAVDARVDVYGLGATLFRLLAGRTPHERAGESSSYFLRMKRITSEPAPSLETLRGGLPAELVRLVARMLAAAPDARPATAAEVAERLAPWVAGANLVGLLAGEEFAPAVGPRPRVRLAAWVALGAAAVAALGAVLLVRPEQAAPAGSGVRVLSGEWEIERKVAPPVLVRAARFGPGGAIIGVANTGLFRLAPPDFAASHALQASGAPWTCGVSPQGAIVSSIHNSAERRWLRVTDLLGARPATLGYADDRDGGPMGFDFVRAGRVPAGTRLREGDVLVADAGFRRMQGRGSLWRFRCDEDAPAELLGEHPALLTAPIDVAAAPGGVFILNRHGYQPPTAPTVANRTRRLVRWDGAAFHSCRLDEPVRAPSGLVFDERTGGFFIAEGTGLPAGEPGHRLLLARPAGERDAYTVSVVADGFGELGDCALGADADGTRLVISDVHHRTLYVLRRK